MEGRGQAALLLEEGALAIAGQVLYVEVPDDLDVLPGEGPQLLHVEEQLGPVPVHQALLGLHLALPG